ncbi:hypothetical protein [Roseimicrobium sp. ORNL1]|uniref:hypothetical protein n=1 Tax=Roseimicrobium sp. ORNL1 TaxID=2711231 RepID=UPI0013E1831A|nr:hypothetical protein [Roseimicrobium sp. ORNL1]QIF01303.1 hypothetical protein G5S37_07135 [Roseimicrobium sp. ORNL1]
MHVARFLHFLLTAGVFALASFPLGTKAAEEAKPATFDAKVAELFKGDWTELHIARALITDTGDAYMTGVVLNRAAPGKPITFRSAHENPGSSKPVDDRLLKSLETHLFKAAAAAHKSVTDMEHLQALTPEEQRKALQQGFQVSGFDFEGLVIWALTPHGKTILKDADGDGSGCHALEIFLEQDFGAKRFEVERSELNEKLGYDPFQKA